MKHLYALLFFTLLFLSACSTSNQAQKSTLPKEDRVKDTSNTANV